MCSFVSIQELTFLLFPSLFTHSEVNCTQQWAFQDHSDTISAEYSRSMQGNYVPFQFSKLYLIYSATDVVSAALDFSMGNVEDRVVDSPPSRAQEMPIYSPSLLRDYRSTPFNKVHVRQCIATYICLKGSFIARQYQTRMKPKRRIMSIIVSAFSQSENQSPLHHNHKARCNHNVWIKKVDFFILNFSQTNSFQRIRRENCYLWARLPILLGVNPILSLLCICLFDNVESVSTHPLGLLVQRPTLTGTRS